jgi:hypothetical protein
MTNKSYMNLGFGLSENQTVPFNKMLVTSIIYTFMVLLIFYPIH